MKLYGQCRVLNNCVCGLCADIDNPKYRGTTLSVVKSLSAERSSVAKYHKNCVLAHNKSTGYAYCVDHQRDIIHAMWPFGAKIVTIPPEKQLLSRNKAADKI